MFADECRDTLRFSKCSSILEVIDPFCVMETGMNENVLPVSITRGRAKAKDMRMSHSATCLYGHGNFRKSPMRSSFC